MLSFGADCKASSDALLGHVTTIEAARDMDVLRSALGEEKLTYLGASYGTKLGATYAELFPDKVGRFVLDGAVDVSLDPTSSAIDQARGFETALRAYVQNCLDSTDNCFLGDSVDEGLATISDLLASIEERAAAGGRPRAHGGQRVLRRHHPALQPRLLVPAEHRAGLGARGQGLGADAARRRLRLAQPRRVLRRQLDRGQLRDQLPRRPDLGAVREGAVAVPGLRGGLADLRPDLRLGDDRVPRHRGEVDREAARHPGRGCRADPGARHDP